MMRNRAGAVEAKFLAAPTRPPAARDKAFAQVRPQVRSELRHLIGGSSDWLEITPEPPVTCANRCRAVVVVDGRNWLKTALLVTSVVHQSQRPHMLGRAVQATSGPCACFCSSIQARKSPVVVARRRPTLKNWGPVPRWRHQRTVLPGTRRRTATSGRVSRSRLDRGQRRWIGHGGTSLGLGFTIDKQPQTWIAVPTAREKSRSTRAGLASHVSATESCQAFSRRCHYLSSSSGRLGASDSRISAVTGFTVSSGSM